MRPRRSTSNRPATPAITTARQAAFHILDQHVQTRRFVADCLAEVFDAGDLNGQLNHRGNDTHQRPMDRAWVTELVCGVVRRRATLDALLTPHVKRPRHQVEDRLWLLLQMGVYQLGLMNSVPPHAAVHETVALADWLRTPRWKGLLNAVLRSVERDLSDDSGEPAANAFPTHSGRFRRLRRDVFPNPVDDPCGYIAEAFSFPRWLIDRWHRNRDWDELIRLAFWFNTPPSTFLRVNPLRTTQADLLAAFANAGIDAIAVSERDVSSKNSSSETPLLASEPDMIRLVSPGAVTQLPGFHNGSFCIQDPTAAAASALLAPSPGDVVLDLCAGRGTKTMHLAELMRNLGTLVAMDTNPTRLVALEQECERLGIDVVECRVLQPDGSNAPDGPFDAVLVDAPCSNTGVLAKRPEARWRVNAAQLDEMVALQQHLLCLAISLVRPGGRIVYSTCSIEPEENSGVIQSVLARHGNVRRVEERTHEPGLPFDGAYQALLEAGRG